MLFSKYVHPYEKTVDKLIKSIKSYDNPAKVHVALEKLMQQNLIITNLWLEKRFKNYTTLTKNSRQKLYSNAEIIEQAFQVFLNNFQSSNQLVNKISQEYKEKFLYLDAIRTFLKPEGIYRYIKSASFSKLLQNPNTTVLEGDCNQIVTLYTFLYSRKYSIRDLQAKILPEHVCLHFQGLDLEATTARFTIYEQYEQIVPITELIAINLLDISDFREMTAKISNKSVLQSAKLAYVLSSKRDLVKRNLFTAYHNLALEFIKQKDFKKALFYANKTNNTELILSLNQQAAVYFVKNKIFQKAKYYAKQSNNQDIIKYINQEQGISLLNKKQYEKARILFKKINNPKLIQSSYQYEYNDLVIKLPKKPTLQQLKKDKIKYKKLLMLAKNAGLKEQESQIKLILGQI